MSDTQATSAASNTPSTTARRKLGAACFSLVLVGTVLSPIQENWKETPHDDFPLTYYPMFSAKRDRVETFYYVIGRDRQGNRHHVTHKIIGPGGLDQVRRQLNAQVRNGDADRVARTVAAKLAAKDRPPWSEIETVEVCRGRYSVDAWFRGGKLPVTEEVKASCAVERGP